MDWLLIAIISGFIALGGGMLFYFKWTDDVIESQEREIEILKRQNKRMRDLLRKTPAPIKTDKNTADFGKW